MKTKEEVLNYLSKEDKKFFIIEYAVLIVLVMDSFYLGDVYNNDLAVLFIMLGFFSLFIMAVISNYEILKTIELALRVGYRVERMAEQYNNDIKRIDDLFFDIIYRLEKLEKGEKQK